MFGQDKRPPLAALALLVLAGCAGRMVEKPRTESSAMGGMAPRVTMEHGEAHAGQPAATLMPDALDAPAATSVADARRSAEMAEEMKGGGHEEHGGQGGHGEHGGGMYVHVDAGREAAAQEEPHDHHAHDAHGGADARETSEVYACPMHPEVTSSTSGKCPKCGMDLVKEKKE